MAIYNPVLPFVGPIGGSLLPGRSVHITGTIHPGATRFALNLQSGPNLYPRDDVAIHISPDFVRNCVVRNNILNMNWGPEETHGHFPLARGQPFEITIHCERDCYKISINGHHYTDFIHRVPYERVTYFSVDGDVTVNRIEYSGGHGHSGGMPMPVPMAYPIPPGGPGHMPLPPPGPHGYYPPPHHHDHHHGGHHHGHCGHHHGHHGHHHGHPGKHHHNGVHYGPGMFGPAAIGSGFAGAQFAGHHSNKKVLKAQKKAHKKALKYGLPIAGAGVGAYALHKAFHHGHHGHHGHSSSSSSSSSSSEEE